MNSSDYIVPSYVSIGRDPKAKLKLLDKRLLLQSTIYMRTTTCICGSHRPGFVQDLLSEPFSFPCVVGNTLSNKAGANHTIHTNLCLVSQTPSCN